jgi:hypothetical protein
MNRPPQQGSPRARLQELLAVPDRDRTDEQWDEINELEILLAPGNREGAPMPGARRGAGPMHSGRRNEMRGSDMPGGQPKPMPGMPGNNPQGKRQGKKFHRGPRKGGPGGGGGGGGGGGAQGGGGQGGGSPGGGPGGGNSAR